MKEIVRIKAKISSIIDRYTVEVIMEDKSKVSVSISQTMKVYEGKELSEGDAIIIQMSPYDLTKGRLHRDTFYGK